MALQIVRLEERIVMDAAAPAAVAAATGAAPAANADPKPAQPADSGATPGGDAGVQSPASTGATTTDGDPTPDSGSSTPPTSPTSPLASPFTDASTGSGANPTANQPAATPQTGGDTPLTAPPQTSVSGGATEGSAGVDVNSGATPATPAATGGDGDAGNGGSATTGTAATPGATTTGSTGLDDATGLGDNTVASGTDATGATTLTGATALTGAAATGAGATGGSAILTSLGGQDADASSLTTMASPKSAIVAAVEATTSDASAETAAESSAPRVLAISSTVTGAEDLAAAATSNVITTIYDANGTPDEILSQIQTVLGGQQAASIALATHNVDAGDIYLADGYVVTTDTLLAQPAITDFWKALGSLVEQDGRIDILTCDVAATPEGDTLVTALEQVTGRNVAASDDTTANPEQGGDWVLETDGVDVTGLYFVDARLKAFQGELANLPPAIGGLHANQSCNEGAAAFVIDDAVSLTDADSADFNGGTLTVRNTAGSGLAEDQLGIRNQGAGAGEIGLSGASVTYEGAAIGTYAGGANGADLVVTFSTASATTTAVQALIQNITYQNTSESPTADRTIGIALRESDGTTSNEATCDIHVKSLNDAPANTVPGAQTVNEGGELAFSSGGGNQITVSDVDAGSSPVETTLTVAHGALTLAGTSNVSITGGANDSATVTIKGTASNVTTAINGLKYTPDADYFGSDQLDVETTDLGNIGDKTVAGDRLADPATDSKAIAITVNAVNDKPVLSGLNANQSCNEGAAAFVIDDAVTLTDVDTTQFNGGTLTVRNTAGSGLAEDQLGIRNQGAGAGEIGYNGGTVTYAGATIGTVAAGTNGDNGKDLVITFSTASATTTAVQALIQNITYQNTSESPTADRSIGIVLRESDGTSSVEQTCDIHVNAINDFPVNTVPGAQTMNEDATLTFAGTISVADADAGSNGLTTTVTVSHGTLTVNAGSGATVGGDGSATVTIAGTTTEINNALNGLTYRPATNYNSTDGSGAETLTVVTTDNGFTGSGGAKTDSGTVSITVNAVNDAPVNTVTGAQTMNEDGTMVFGGSLSVADADAAEPTGGDLTTTLTVSHGTLTVNAGSGATVGGDGSGTVTITGTTTEINNALNGLTYRPTTNYNSTDGSGAETLTMVTTDNGATGSGGALTDSGTVSITVNAVNDAPVNTVPGAQTMNEDATLTFAGTISVADADAAEPAGGDLTTTLTVSHGTLTVNAGSGATIGGDGSGNVTITGTTTEINNALNGLTYRPTTNYNSTDGSGAETLTVVTTDNGATGSGGAKQDTQTVGITVNAVNDAPVNTVPGAQTMNEDATLTFAGTISVADADAAEPAGGDLTTTLTVSHGTLTVNAGSGATIGGDGSGNVTITGTTTEINNALNGLTYRPTTDYNTAADGAETLTVVTTDNGFTGSGGAKQDTKTVGITVNAVNDAPVNTVPGAQTMNEDGTMVFGGSLSVADDDADEPAGGDLTTTLTVSHGTLTVNAGSGATVVGDGSGNVAITGTTTEINNALNGLTYRPTTDYNSTKGSGAETLTMVTTDNGNTGSGGILTDSDTVAITVNAVNDAPANTVPGEQTINEDTTLTFNALGGNPLSISDVDADEPAGGDLTTTVTVSHGTLTVNAGSGATVGGDGSGTVTITGTTTEINNALNGLVYRPTTDYNTAADGAETLTVVTTDNGATGSGGAKQDTKTVGITVNAVNDAPINSVPAAQTMDEDTTLTFNALGGNLLSISDVDADEPTGGNLTATLTVLHGTLKVAAGSGASVVGDNSASVAITGTTTQINAALNGLVYTPTADTNKDLDGQETLTMVTTDNGNTGSGGALTDTDTVNINVTAVQDAPRDLADPSDYTSQDENNNSNERTVAQWLGASGVQFNDPDGVTNIGMAITGAVWSNPYADPAIVDTPHLAGTDPYADVLDNLPTTYDGKWQYQLNGTATWVDFPTVSDTNALLLGPTDKVRFVADTYNATTATLTYYLWDQTDLGKTITDTTPGSTETWNVAAGNTVNLQKVVSQVAGDAANWGARTADPNDSLAYSRTTATAINTVQDVNDAPVQFKNADGSLMVDANGDPVFIRVLNADGWPQANGESTKVWLFYVNDPDISDNPESLLTYTFTDTDTGLTVASQYVAFKNPDRDAASNEAIDADGDPSNGLQMTFSGTGDNNEMHSVKANLSTQPRDITVGMQVTVTDGGAATVQKNYTITVPAGGGAAVDPTPIKEGGGGGGTTGGGGDDGGGGGGGGGGNKNPEPEQPGGTTGPGAPVIVLATAGENPLGPRQSDNWLKENQWTEEQSRGNRWGESGLNQFLSDLTRYSSNVQGTANVQAAASNILDSLASLTTLTNIDINLNPQALETINAAKEVLSTAIDTLGLGDASRDAMKLINETIMDLLIAPLDQAAVQACSICVGSLSAVLEVAFTADAPPLAKRMVDVWTNVLERKVAELEEKGFDVSEIKAELRQLRQHTGTAALPAGLPAALLERLARDKAAEIKAGVQVKG